MKEILLTFHLMFFIMGNLNGQLSNEFTARSSHKQENSPNKLFFLVAESFPLDLSGKTFMNDQFITATIVDFEDEEFKVDLRYRFADDEMQIMHQKKIKALYPQKIKKIIIKEGDSNQTFISTKYLAKKIITSGYFELLSEGKMNLLKQFKRNKKGNIKTIFLTQMGDQPAKCFKVKKSSILKLLKKHKSKVSQFIVENKIDVSKEIELRKVFDFYNSLS